MGNPGSAFAKQRKDIEAPISQKPDEKVNRMSADTKGKLVSCGKEGDVQPLDEAVFALELVVIADPDGGRSKSGWISSRRRHSKSQREWAAPIVDFINPWLAAAC